MVTEYWRGKLPYGKWNNQKDEEAKLGKWLRSMDVENI